MAGLKKYIKEENKDNLYTVDLICHGTPSPKVLEIFLQQYGYSLDSIQDIQFRTKTELDNIEEFEYIVNKGICDKYSLGFINSLFCTENCYSCSYARIERVGDITVGDSWGSKLPFEEQKKGVSLILCQSEKGEELLKESKMHFEKVEIGDAVANNQQLSHPAERHLKRELFFVGIKKNKKFNNLIYKCLPKQCVRQDLKNILLKTRLIHSSTQKLNYGIMIKGNKKD